MAREAFAHKIAFQPGHESLPEVSDENGYGKNLRHRAWHVPRPCSGRMEIRVVTHRARWLFVKVLTHTLRGWGLAPTGDEGEGKN